MSNNYSEKRTEQIEQLKKNHSCKCIIVGTVYCPIHRSTMPCCNLTHPDSIPCIRAVGHTGDCTPFVEVANRLAAASGPEITKWKPSGVIVEAFKNEVYQVLVREYRSKNPHLTHNQMERLLKVVDNRIEACFDSLS